MESSIESTIKKLKLQEHDNEAKLKEKRTHDTMVISLNRSMRDSLSQATKLKEKYLEAVMRTEALKSRLELEKARRNALSGLLEDTRKELKILQEKSTQGVSVVWNLRSSLCKSVQNVSDQCDVWALITKPKSHPILLPIRKVVNENTECAEGCDDRLTHAIERQTKMHAERDRLRSEPDTGEEFLRIKNALRYSAAMAANLLGI